jgi:WD40 repeat protein/uncharacterized caspase-like protein
MQPIRLTASISDALRSLTTHIVSAAVALAIAGGGTALAQDQAPEFFLDFDTGGHRAFIKDLVFSPDGEFLLSASDDKTIRVWDWQKQETVRTFRGFVGEKHEGKIFGLAISPDGKTVAAGGYFGTGLGESPPYGDVRLFDFRTGKVTAVLKAQEFAVYDVAFSPDGQYLAAGGQDGFAYVWRRDESAEMGWTADTKLDADSWHIQKVEFAAGGSRLIAATTDNGVRLFDMATKAEIAVPDAEALRDSGIRALAVSADGSRFATGNDDGQVHVWSAATGAVEFALPKQDYLVGSLTFAGNDRIVVSCGYRCADRNRTTVWKLGENAPSREYRGHDGTVYASAATPDGLLVATAGGTRHAIHLWDPLSGEFRHELQGIGHPVTAVGIDAAGTAIAWGILNPCPDRVACPEVMGALETALLLPLPERFFEEPIPQGEAGIPFHRADHALNGWSLTAAKGGEENLENGLLKVSKDGAELAWVPNDATTGYLHAAFTLLGGGEHFLTGGNDGTLIEYDSATGKQVGEFLGGHTGEINAMSVAPERKLLVTGSADQTLRLWNLDTRKLIVSMLFADGEWVMWLPQGYYHSSDDGDKLIGWHVNQGRQSEGRFVRAGQLKRFLFSPEMVRRAIILGSAEAAVEEMRPDVGNELQRLLQRKPPEFDVKVAADQSNVRDGYVAVEVTGIDEAGTSAESFSILSNSRNVGASATRSVSPDGKTTIIEVPVEDGENSISITGVNEFGYVTERGVTTLASRKTEAKKGKLYVIAIGVEKYPNIKADLAYPVDDAVEMLKVLKERTAPLYSGMETLILLNEESLGEVDGQSDAVTALIGDGELFEPDSDNIADQVEDFLSKPGPDDMTIVFVAGHGMNLGEDYFFIPTDGARQDADKWKKSSLVEWEDIQEAVNEAEGVRLMLIDTCHAQNAFNPKLGKDAEDARVIVFSATAANKLAQEQPALGHGVFTYALLQGLKGGAVSGAGGVRLIHLAAFIYDEIVKLTEEAQEPFYYIGNMGNILLAQP